MSIKAWLIKSIKNAAEELRSFSKTSKDITCGFDGSWQKRGYTTSNRLVRAVAIKNGKCIDFEKKKKKTIFK